MLLQHSNFLCKSGNGPTLDQSWPCLTKGVLRHEPEVLVVVEHDVFVGHGDVDDVVAKFHRSLDAGEVAEHYVDDHKLTGAKKG